MLGLVPLVESDALLRRRDDVAQPHAFGVEVARLLFGGGEVVAQLTLLDARRIQDVLEAELLALRLLVSAQRLADRIDQLADRALDGLKLADLVLGVDQEVADGLVVLAKLGGDRKE